MYSHHRYVVTVYRAILCLAWLLVAVPGGTQAQTGTLVPIDLDTLGDGGSSALDINAAGQVVVLLSPQQLVTFLHRIGDKEHQEHAPEVEEEMLKDMIPTFKNHRSGL